MKWLDKVDLQWFALLTPGEGEIEMLKRILNFHTPDDVSLRLYTNDKTPAEGDAKADYTELNKAGYASVTLTGANWAITMDGATAGASFSQVTFTLTGQCTCYGYHVTASGDVRALFAEKFTDGPYVIPSGGGSVKVTPNLELD